MTGCLHSLSRAFGATKPVQYRRGRFGPFSRVTALTAILLVGAAAPGGAIAADGACDLPDVTVVAAAPSDVRDICDAVRAVQAYIDQLGLAFKPRLQVMLADGPELSTGASPSHGRYNARTAELTIGRRPGESSWGLLWTPDLGRSFRIHEVAHAAVVQLLGARWAEMRREWHEFIAYTIQLELMAVSTRQQILALFPDVEAATRLEQINEFTYGADPERFAVLAHKTYQANGGPELIRRLIARDAVPPAIPHTLPLHGGQ